MCRSHQEHFDPLQPVAYFVLDDDWFVITSFVGLRLLLYFYNFVSGKFKKLSNRRWRWIFVDLKIRWKRPQRAANLPASMQQSNWVTWCWFTCKWDTTSRAHLALFYKGLHGLSAISCDSLCRPVLNSRHSDSDTFNILSSRFDCYKYSFFPRTISEWNKLTQGVRSKPPIVSFRSALLKAPGPVKNNFLAMALCQ